jgi:hypothetical protein
VETYGATAANGHAAISVYGSGEVNPRDTSIYWGFSDAGLSKLAGRAGLADTGDTGTVLIDGHPRIIATLRHV